MRAYYFDNIPGDQRLPHDSGNPVSDEILKSIGALYWHIPTNQQEQIDTIAEERSYKHRDIITVTKQDLGDEYEPLLEKFFQEHMHQEEETRYVIDGSGFFDLREHSSGSWIRCQIVEGDLFAIPPGIYHRFTLDENNMIKSLRFYKDKPNGTHINRDSSTDVHPSRVDYLKNLAVN
ncbi:Acireductone dioxygenase ARD family [Suillus subalutaceus]|uniref:Acireductone dioxygenase ARD family n=1 Tax=Suillus subalutaceus TaxID=48586 RepID=UPI001B86FDEF|nr:Acireductone dioxygenase ARD family [Suillus subalutaceus]KAG1868375.1 Acireductone dioxygenase ARD family [Suillus subalutaceus]